MYFPDYDPKKCYLRKSRADEINQHDAVERYGYVPFAKRVQAMEQAGINLLAIRAEMCDFKPDDKIDWDKDFSRLNDFDKFQQEEMARKVAEQYQKMQKLMQSQNASNQAIEYLKKLGYSVVKEEAETQQSGVNNDDEKTE